MNPTILGFIGPGFLNQVATLGVWFQFRGLGFKGCRFGDFSLGFWFKGLWVQGLRGWVWGLASHSPNAVYGLGLSVYGSC